MLPKILKLKGVQPISRAQQKTISGGGPFPPADDCGCIVMGSQGYLEIIAVSCSSTCPDGTQPIGGLGF
ncbi:hypothetical protein [Aquimarina sp. 2201CG5-10]|uniref:hypothetical protein n=1 Tax=Aquimarina callyspongiae TaxID=3098150 RepID=UPI002AB46C8E|nr:hypothetical protein [Aquimarina sp. 2201CG5-10]MDY8136810.1 hypothetical protein [Aquimarina sp. 2201CG5-10]